MAKAGHSRTPLLTANFIVTHHYFFSAKVQLFSDMKGNSKKILYVLMIINISHRSSKRIVIVGEASLNL